jgi:hypothetical protein
MPYVPTGATGVKNKRDSLIQNLVLVPETSNNIKLLCEKFYIY